MDLEYKIILNILIFIHVNVKQMGGLNILNINYHLIANRTFMLFLSFINLLFISENDDIFDCQLVLLFLNYFSWINILKSNGQLNFNVFFYNTC